MNEKINNTLSYHVLLIETIGKLTPKTIQEFGDLNEEMYELNRKLIKELKKIV